jgi:hypothetical protein
VTKVMQPADFTEKVRDALGVPERCTGVTLEFSPTGHAIVTYRCFLTREQVIAFGAALAEQDG